MQNPVGTVRHFSDGNRYVYLRTASPIAAGNAVTYAPGGAASRTQTPTSFGPVAWATTAMQPAEWAWFFLTGSYPVSVTTVAMDAPVYATATVGVLDDVAVPGNRVSGAVFRTAGTGTATIQVGEGGAFLQSDL